VGVVVVVVVKRRSGGLISALPISFLSAFEEKGVVSSFFESVFFCTGDRGWSALFLSLTKLGFVFKGKDVAFFVC
jgi:hypothetical protein